MFKEGLKNLTVTELADETGIKRQRLYNYIHHGTPEDYEYSRAKTTGAGEPSYLLSERDIEMLAIIHELAQSYSVREVKEMLQKIDMKENEIIVEPEELTEIDQSENKDIIIVPQILAEFSEEYKKNKKPIIKILSTPETSLEKKITSYIFDKTIKEKEQIKRQDLLFNVLANGYDEIEKMMYRIIFEDNDAGFFLYKADDVSVTISNDLDNYNEYKDRLLLTLEEVNNYDSRFMLFAHPEY